MKKLIEDRFDDIGAAIINGKTDVILIDRQSDNKKRQKHTKSKEGEKLKRSEKANDERLKELKEVEGLEEYTGISGSDRRGNGKELDLEEILSNGEGNDEENNDDTDIKIRDTRKLSSCQQTIIKMVTTTVPLWLEVSAALKAAAPAVSALVVTPLRWKASVIGDLTDGLEQASLVKNNQKQGYNIGVEETKHLNIHEKLSIEKK